MTYFNLMKENQKNLIRDYLQYYFYAFFVLYLVRDLFALIGRGTDDSQFTTYVAPLIVAGLILVGKRRKSEEVKKI